MTEIRFVDSPSEAAAFLTWVGERRGVPLGVDVETDAQPLGSEVLRMVQFGDAESGWALPWPEYEFEIRSAVEQHAHFLVAHNALFDVRVLLRAGVEVPDWSMVVDTMTLAGCENPHRSLSLKSLSSRICPDLGLEMVAKKMFDWMDKENLGWDTVPVDSQIYWVYGVLDAIACRRLFDHWSERWLYSPLYIAEHWANAACSNMSQRGVWVDADAAVKVEGKLKGYAEQLNVWAVQSFGVRLNKRSQVIAALAKDDALPAAMTSSGKVSLTKASLKSVEHPVADAVLKYRNAEKLAAFCSGFVEHSSRFGDGRMRPNILVNRTKTGRMSMTKPNLQQVPRNAHVRSLIRPEAGNRFVCCDFSQMEMRLFARLSGSSGMAEAFAAGGDLHERIAGMIWGDENVTPRHRQLTKNVVYGLQYGAGEANTAKTAGISLDEARDVRGRLIGMFPELESWPEEIGNMPEARTPVGRLQLAGKFPHRLVNYMIQGAGADAFKQAISRVHMSWIGEFAVLPVHDELIFECPEGVAGEVAREAEVLMSDAEGEPVLPAEAKVTGSWGESYWSETSERSLLG